MIESTATISDGEASISAKAVVGVDLAQKGMQVPQQFGSASSYGKKYALGNLFIIDETQDSNADKDHGKDEAKYKPTLDKNTDAFNKAVKYIKDGGTINAINTKYKVSIPAKAQLKKYEQE